ncbi:MAG: transposase [Lysobacterales bacterium]|nr:MAG: transposase [Xanthomonadales bacterium]
MASKVRQGYRALRRGRYSRAGGIYFITTVIAGRIPWFAQFELARHMCRKLHEPAALADAANLCWVVMPDHVHLLLQLREAPLANVLNTLKSKSAIELNREIGREGRFWEPGFHDHALRKEEDLLGIARYIVANPLRAGLVRRLGDYPYWNAVWL